MTLTVRTVDIGSNNNGNSKAKVNADANGETINNLGDIPIDPTDDVISEYEEDFESDDDMTPLAAQTPQAAPLRPQATALRAP